MMLQGEADFFDLFKIWPQDLDPDGSPDTRGQHIDAGLNGHREGVGHAGDRQGVIHLVLQFFHGHPFTPLLFRFQINDRLEHLQRRWIRGCLRPPGLTEDLGDLGDFFQNVILHLEEFPDLGHGRPGQRDGHIKQRSFIERWHKFRTQLHERVDGEGHDDDGGNDHRLPETDGEAGNGLVDFMEDEADGVLLLRPDLPPNEQGHENGCQGDGQERGEEHGKGLRVGQRLEEPSRLGLKREDGEEARGDDQKREEERWSHFLGRLDNDIRPAPRLPLVFPLLQLLMGVFHHDNGGVHHGADGDSDAGEAHNVGGDAQVIHADEGHEHGDGQGDDHYQGAGQVKKKDKANYAHCHGQFDNLIFESCHGAHDEV